MHLNATVGLLFLGRLLIGFYFVFFAALNLFYSRAFDVDKPQKKTTLTNIIFWFCVAWEIAGGMMLISHIGVKWVAISLIPCIIISLLLFHPFWDYLGKERTVSQAFFVANLTVALGSLLLLIAIFP